MWASVGFAAYVDWSGRYAELLRIASEEMHLVERLHDGGYARTLGAHMAERHRIMISVSDEVKKLAEAQLEQERGRTNVSKSTKLPTYLSLLLERQVYNPSRTGDEQPAAPTKRAARARKAR